MQLDSINMNNSPSQSEPIFPSHLQTFLLVLSIMFATSLLSIAIGWFKSVDVKGWWSLALVFYGAIDAIYALIFSLLSRLRRPFSLVFSVKLNLALAAILLLHTVIYYCFLTDWCTAIDSTGTMTLLQQLIYSDFTPLAIYGIFLVLALLRALKKS